MIGVNNDKLMNNHQMELLEALEKNSYLIGIPNTSEINSKVKRVTKLKFLVEGGSRTNTKGSSKTLSRAEEKCGPVFN